MTSALYQYTVAFYDKLSKQAKRDTSGELIFQGKLKEAFDSTGASSAYYTPVRQLLDSPEDDPCITLITRGNSKQGSTVRLNHPPPEAWENFSAKALTSPREGATLVVDIEARLERVEAWRESLGEVNIGKALIDMETRLRKLEREARKKNGKATKA
jgi:hypothetical protein